VIVSRFLSSTLLTDLSLFNSVVESELYEQAGTTEKASKSWMPLDVFTTKAMDGLKEGKVQIPVGLDAPFKKFEEGKLEYSIAFLESRQK